MAHITMPTWTHTPDSPIAPSTTRTPAKPSEGMSPSPLSPVPPASSVRLRLPDMKAPLWSELKRTISVKTMMQFSNSDMTLHQQNDAAYKYFHGEGALVSQVEKFMGGTGNFANLWSTESSDHGPL